MYSTHSESAKTKCPHHSQQENILRDFENFILGRDHPCLMAQNVFSLKQVDLNVYPELGTPETSKAILKDLANYLQHYDFETKEVYSFIAVFKGHKNFTEKEFESLMWRQLQVLYELDEEDWDPEVASDPDSDQFSFSLLGKAFYMVGMHPNSSRKARQSPYPAIVFNLHWQFEQLREMGAYQSLRDRIRERDKKLQGNINPMLEDFGNSSEALQYSGRKLDKDWKCPFHPKK